MWKSEPVIYSIFSIRFNKFWEIVELCVTLCSNIGRISLNLSSILNDRYIHTYIFLSLFLFIYIYMQSWKQCSLPVITTMALWQLMHLCTWCTSPYITAHHVPKCMSCNKAIVVITGRAHCFRDCIYIMPILLLWDLSTLCAMDHFWPLMLYLYD